MKHLLLALWITLALASQGYAHGHKASKRHVNVYQAYRLPPPPRQFQQQQQRQTVQWLERMRNDVVLRFLNDNFYQTK